MHARVILSQDVAEYAPLFSEIADAYYEKEMYLEAGHIYEMLGGDAGVRRAVTSSNAASFLNPLTPRQAACTCYYKRQRAGGWLVTLRKQQKCTIAVRVS